jgi:hypothetical protein
MPPGASKAAIKSSAQPDSTLYVTTETIFIFRTLLKKSAKQVIIRAALL